MRLPTSTTKTNFVVVANKLFSRHDCLEVASPRARSGALQTPGAGNGKEANLPHTEGIEDRHRVKR